MYTVIDRDTFINNFVHKVDENIKENCGDLNIEKFMDECDSDKISAAVRKIRANVESAIPDEFPIPKASLYISPSGSDGISTISISTSNSITSSRKFKYRVVIVRGTALEDIKKFFVGVYADLVVDDMILNNLGKVNEVVAQAAEKAGISYKVLVVPPVGHEGKKLSMMSDDEVVFVADPDRAFELEDIIALQDVPKIAENAEDSEEADNDVDGVCEDASMIGVTAEEVESAIAQEVDIFATAQTPEQLVEKRGGLLISYVCDISKRVKPMTYIKKITNKEVRKVRGGGDVVAYFQDGDVFSLVARRDGKYEVLLSPFNISTFKKEDYDVLGAIEK